MDKKITRRAALGALVGGLAVSPFFIHRWRSGSREDVLETLLYGPFDVEGRGFLTDMPPEKVREAFGILFRERDAWRRFRGFSGDVFLTRAGFSETVEVNLSLQLLPSAEMSEVGFPWVYQFAGKDIVSKDHLWTYTLDRSRGGNVSHFEGEKVKTEVIDFQALAFTFPLEGMHTLSNERVQELFRTLYKVSVNHEASSPVGSFIFRPLESGTDMGQFFTENGVMRILRSSRLAHDSSKGIQWEGFDWQSFGRLRFPSRIELSELTYGEGDSFEQKLLETYVFKNFTVS